MSEAVTSLLEFSADEKMRIKAEQRELFLMDQAVRMKHSRAEGVAEGEAKGRAEGHADVARRMLRKKMPVAEVASLTGLSEAEVKRLAADENV